MLRVEDKYLKYFPDEERIYELARTYQKKKSYKKAISLFYRAIKVGRRDKWVYYWRGKAQEELEDISAAKKSYITCLKKDNKHKYAMLRLANIYETEGKKESALKLYKRIVKYYPDFASNKKIYNMKSVILIIISFAVLGVANGQQSKLKIKAGTRVGYDSNIFLSPREYENKDDVLIPFDSLSKNGAFNFSHLDVNYDWTSKKKKDFFHTAISSDAKNYGDSTLRDFYGLSYFSKTSFKHKYQKYSWIEPSLKMGRQRLVRTTIIGDEYTRPYSFYQAYPKLTVQQRLIKNTWLQAWAGYDMRTYDGRDTISNFQSFSYNSIDYGARLSYRHKIAKKLMKYELSWIHRNRQYSEWLIDEVFDEDGYEIPLDSLVAEDSTYVYPLNNWVYDIVKLKLNYPLTKRIKLSAYYSVNHKADRGEGDLGFTTPSYGGKISYKKGKFVASYKYAWVSRNYHNLWLIPMMMNLKPSFTTDLIVMIYT